MYDIDNESQVFKNLGFPHFSINKNVHSSNVMGLHEVGPICKMLQHTSMKKRKS